jgi:hypothetical protein
MTADAGYFERHELVHNNFPGAGMEEDGLAVYERVVTHDDFDGVASAALVGYFLELDRFVFAGPGDIIQARVPVRKEDIVCDLPYPLVCGMWFDHHAANIEDVVLRGIDPGGIPGLRSEEPSCARVIVNYFGQDFEIDEEIESLAASADRIDSFAYESVEDWRAERPESLIDAAIKLKAGSTPAERRNFLRQLTFWLMDEPLEEAAGRSQVKNRASLFRAEEEEMLKLIGQHFGYLDPEKKIVLLDFSGCDHRVKIVKNLVQLLDPDAHSILEVNCLFDRQIKTTDLSFSMNLTINGMRQAVLHDLGEIMRELNIGSGHRGAASGTVRAKSKAEMLRARERTLQVILEKWRKQGA